MFSLRMLVFLFLAVPLLEIYLLIKVGGIVGAIPTVFLVVFTAVLGAMLLRVQGFSTLGRARDAMARGEVPAMELLEGVLLLFGGALLLTPGFFTDAIGFLCLIPQLRRRLILWAIGRGMVQAVGGGRPGGSRHDAASKTIEGEYWRDDDRRR